MKKVYLILIILIVVSCGEEKPSEVEKVKEQPQIEITSPTPEMILFHDNEVIDTSALKLVANRIITTKGDTFELQLPIGFEIMIAKQGFKRIRFMDESPDNRIFMTDMYNLSDNEKGKIHILENFDESTGTFSQTTVWKRNLRNPNDIKFYKDSAGQDWIYVAETHAITRYKYQKGEFKSSNPGEIITRFPDYGLSYKYGGWHLTRSMDFNDNKLYVSVGSSCNSCEELETERERASILVMNPDGSSKEFYTEGLRNAVEIKWVQNQLFATNMGADHFGEDAPDDQFLKINKGDNYGWPYCYQNGWNTLDDNSNEWERKKVNCAEVPEVYQPLGAHVAPLGFDYFAGHPDRELTNYFLVANHGSVKLRRGYNIVRVRNGRMEVFLTGFRGEEKLKHGRPCDIYQYKNGFLFTDDYRGIVYYVRKKK